MGELRCCGLDAGFQAVFPRQLRGYVMNGTDCGQNGAGKLKERERDK